MTCDFYKGLDPKDGEAMLAAHWAANGSRLGRAGDRAQIEKATTAVGSGEQASARTPKAGHDLQDYDPRLNQRQSWRTT